MSGSKRKSSSDVTGTAKKLQEVTMETKVKIIETVEWSKKVVEVACSYNVELLALWQEKITNEDLIEVEAQRKDEGKQEEEEVTEQLKRFTMQEMARGFSLFEEALLVFETQDPNVERYTKVAADVQNAIQCYRVIYDEKKRAATQTSLDGIFKSVDRIESSKEPEPVPSTSGVSETAACPPSPIADDPSALPSPNSSPSSSQ